MAATPVAPLDPLYSERLLPGPLGWAVIGLFAGFLAIALYPVNPTVAFTTGAIVAVVGVAVAVLTTPRVAVRDGELRAGPAHIPVGLLGAVTELDAEATRLELGPALDARAYVCLRAWARTAVRAQVVDPADRTPYWIVSTRRPGELAAAISAARGHNPA